MEKLRLSPDKAVIPGLSPSDQDGDGLTDSHEQELAELFAPVVYHASDEPNLPANVDWFLEKTSLCFYDVRQNINEALIVSPKQTDLHWLVRTGPTSFDSYECRDSSKRATFY